MSETREKEIIEGTVEDIRFRNEQNGYTVLSVGCDDDLYHGRRCIFRYFRRRNP